MTDETSLDKTKPEWVGLDPRPVDPASRATPIIQPDLIGHVLCPVHGEPFRSQWPKGVGAIVKLFADVFGTDEQLAEEVNATTNAAELPFEQAVLVCLARRSVCERVTPDRLIAMYAEAKIGKFDVCDVCGRPDTLGTPYRTEEVLLSPQYRRKRDGRPRVRTKVRRHVCFERVTNAWEAHKQQS